MSDETLNPAANPEPIPPPAPPTEEDVKKAQEVLQKAAEERKKKFLDNCKIASERMKAVCEELQINLGAEPIVVKRLSDGRLVIGAEPVFTERKPPVEGKV